MYTYSRVTRLRPGNAAERGSRRTLVVRFVKRTTGEVRRMVCIYYPEAAEKATFRFNPVAKGLIAVWDVEKGARCLINLDGVQSVKLSGRRLQPKERRAKDREAKQLQRPWENLETANREIDALFNTSEKGAGGQGRDPGPAGY